jgi:phosphoribosylanthranilate isomerase
MGNTSPDAPATRRDSEAFPSVRKVRVKICGVTTPGDARSAVEAGADAIGLNFFRASRRAIDVETAAAIVAVLPEQVWRVGVFVDATRGEIASIVARVGLGAIQLHGDEPPGAETGWSVPTIRAIRIGSTDDAARALAAYAPDYFLCEGALGGSYGGRGAIFDWLLARAIPAERLIVAGGLTPENVADAVRTLRPFAVDVASGVESSPGVKDPARLRAFIAHAKSA